MLFKRQETYEEVLKQSIEEAWDFIPTRCPHCQNGAVGYADEDIHGNRYHNLTNCWCGYCHKEWTEKID